MILLKDLAPASFIEKTVEEIKQTLKDDKIVLGLSGGVDSSVVATLLHKAVGKNLTSIFVDTGLLRKNEFQNVLESYKNEGLNIVGINAKNRFFDELKGVSAPEKKRKIIGRLFIEIFEEEASKIKNVKWLGQGTIYPDIVESKLVNGQSVAVKSHHNVGGLPQKMNLKVIEPIKFLYKNEVRIIGEELKISKTILERHPFPGPGLAIRILGEITPEKVEILQEADYIFINGLKKNALYNKVWQAGAILLPVQSVGINDNIRTYENVVALRAVNSIDGMTADWVHLPFNFLKDISNEIINNVKGINRVVYDISSKPPATIEWE